MSKKDKKSKANDEDFDFNAWLDLADREKLAAEQEQNKSRIEAGADPFEILVSDMFRAHTAAMNWREDTRPEVANRLLSLFFRCNDIKDRSRDWPVVMDRWENDLQEILYQFDAFHTLLIGLKAQKSVDECGYEVLYKTLKQVRGMLEDACTKIDSDVRPGMPSY